MKEKNKAFFYLGFIVLIWFILYLVCSFIWTPKLGWDEVSYLTTARGIAEDFDFGSRTTTVQGLIKYSFPQHTHHYPLLSLYIAIFFKLFGVSLRVAYFSTWVSALACCIFIFLSMLILTEKNYKFSFFVAISFLFLPKIANYCNSAMMEIPGGGLVSIISYFFLKDVSRSKINPFLLGAGFMLLFFYKSLFLGIFFGLIAIIFLIFSQKLSSLTITNKFPLYLNLLAFLGTVSAIYVCFTKFVFLPLAPMMNFHPRQEGAYGTYSDFAGGFFKDVFGNLKINLLDFYNNLLCRYVPFNYFSLSEKPFTYRFSPDWLELGVFYLIAFFVLFALFASWRKTIPLQKIIIIFTLASVISFNLVFVLVSTASVNILCRYNMLYIPLLLMSSGCIIELFMKSKWLGRNKLIFLLFLILGGLVYFVYYSYSTLYKLKNDDGYHKIAHNNSEIVKSVVGKSSPRFVYFNTGQHTTWDLYPVRVIIMEATNNQIKQINKKLPKPIEYLFLSPANELFKQNQNLILKGQPIIDNWYTFYGVVQQAGVIVYKLRVDSSGK